MPAGKISGTQFEAPDPHAEGSIKVNIATAKWKNFSSSAPGGSNPIGLYAYLKAIDYREAARELGEEFNIERSQPTKISSGVWDSIVPIPDFAPMAEGLPTIPAFAERSTSELKGFWCYLNRNGEPLAWRVRIDAADGSKKVMPLTFCRNRETGATDWRWKDLPAPRPLYGLEWLALEPVTRVLIVEGEKTCDAARRFLADGWCVLTWPGGTQRVSGKHVDWSPLLNLPKEARIVLWPDADDTGVKAMGQIAGILRGRCEIIQPDLEWPKGWDLADAEEQEWTTDQVLEYIRTHKFEPPKPNERDQLPPNAPHLIAEAYVRRVATTPDGVTIRRWDGSWWSWTGMHSVRRAEEDQRAQVGRFIISSVDLIQAGKNGDLHPKQPNRALLDNVMDALRVNLNLPADIRPPGWLDGVAPFDTSAMVAVENGLLQLSTGDLHPSSPHWFCLSALKVHYEGAAVCPGWEAFLEGIWEDQQSRETLQEIFGYLLTADTRQQKAFMIVGPPRSGKGTIGRVLASLLGPDAVSRPALADFGIPFGLEPLIGKSLAIISDARLDGNVPAGVLAERLLAISGEDTINIARKYKEAWNGPLSVRFMLLTNELPRFRDASGALPNRFIVLKMTRTWLGKEDPTLFERLAFELPGILNWAMAGWMRLQERGHFTQPDSARDMTEQLASIASPLQPFIEESCLVGEKEDASIGELYRHYADWCKRGEMKPMPVTLFGRDLRAAMPQLSFYKPHGEARRIKGIGVKYFDGPNSSGSGENKDEQNQGSF